MLLRFYIRQDWVYQVPKSWMGKGHRSTSWEHRTAAKDRLRVWLGTGSSHFNWPFPAVVEQE